MGEGHRAFDVFYYEGLGVSAAAYASGSVTDVSDGYFAFLAQVAQGGFVEDLVYQANIATVSDGAAGIESDAGAFLAAVLKGVKPSVTKSGKPVVNGAIPRRGVDAEHTTFLVNVFVVGLRLECDLIFHSALPLVSYRERYREQKKGRRGITETFSGGKFLYVP
jgi:hypothetical protein